MPGRSLDRACGVFAATEEATCHRSALADWTPHSLVSSKDCATLILLLAVPSVWTGNIETMRQSLHYRSQVVCKSKSDTFLALWNCLFVYFHQAYVIKLGCKA